MQQKFLVEDIGYRFSLKVLKFESCKQIVIVILFE